MSDFLATLVFIFFLCAVFAPEETASVTRGWFQDFERGWNSAAEFNR